MYDLISDQETGDLLLTEADYSTSSAFNNEIAQLKPLSREDDRIQVLNEWNVMDTTDSDEDSDQEANGSNYESAQRSNNSSDSDASIVDERDDYQKVLNQSHLNKKNSDKCLVSWLMPFIAFIGDMGPVLLSCRKQD